MDAEILAVGTELLMGQIANTNAQYISKRLQDIGVSVFYHSVVGDNPDRLKACLQIALSRSDIVIMTGGLGPTQDDLTKETVTNLIGRKLVLHEPSLQKITDLFKRTGWTMTESNAKQAYFPADSLVLNNDHGTAPGCLIADGGKVLTMLPGPPSEMKPMFDQHVIPYLEAKSEFRIVSKYLNVFGVGESYLEKLLLDLIDGQTNPTIATYAKEGEVTVRITAKMAKDDAEDVIAPVEAIISERLGSAIYATGSDSLEDVVGRLLQEYDLSLAVLETITGGMLTASLSKLDGLSKGRLHGMVKDHDGPSDRDSAVTEARNIMDSFHSNIGIALIGRIEETEKDMGGIPDTAFIALASKEKDGDNVIELKLFGDTNRKRHSVMLHALNMIRKHIMGIT